MVFCFKVIKTVKTLFLAYFIIDGKSASKMNDIIFHILSSFYRCRYHLPITLKLSHPIRGEIDENKLKTENVKATKHMRSFSKQSPH